jgi:hypothetical protein
MENVSMDDLQVHLRAIIKSNLVSFGLSSVDIDSIMHNLSDDIVAVIENFISVNGDTKESDLCGLR